MLLDQAMDNAAVRAAWKDRRRERIAAWSRGNTVAQDFEPTGKQAIAADEQIDKQVRSFKGKMARSQRAHRAARDDDMQR
jgi:hypothetical protein